MTAPVDIYVRVSRVGGRNGDSFISPQDQEKRCRLTLEADGYKIGKVFVDLDESGATQDRPAFNEVMRRVEEGTSGGVAVARLNRFGRTTRGVLEDVSRIEAAGGVFLAVEEKLDTSTSIGRFVLRMFASLAELELDRIREGWATTHASMVSRGVQSGRPPSGYSKGPDKRLVPNEYAPLIRDAYRLRADGMNWHELARWLTAQGLPTQKGNPWQAAAARALLRNRAYLGEARHGELVLEGAHEPLVDEATFRRANRKGRKNGGNRGGPGHLLGDGLVRCAVCGAGMVRASTTSHRNKRYWFLRCPTQGGGHPTIGYEATQEHLIKAALERIPIPDGTFADVAVDEELQEKLASVLEEIESLDRALEDDEISATVYARAMTKAEQDRDLLRELVDQQGTTGTVVQINRSAQADRDGARHLLLSLLEPESAERVSGEIPNARRLLHELLGQVTVATGRGPVEERITIA